MKAYGWILVANVLALPIAADARPITLAEALATAERSPQVLQARATQDEAGGFRDQAKTIAYNPTLTGAGGPAFAAGRRVFDFELGFAQILELGGKRAKRARVAGADLEAAHASTSAAVIAARADAWRAYHLATIARDRVAIAIDNETTAREIVTIAEDRLRLGSATQTEVNVAIANAGRALAARQAAERAALTSRVELARLLGMNGVDLEPSDRPPPLAALALDEDAAVAGALAARPDLAAIARSRDARASQVALADALAIPNAELFGVWAHSSVERSDAFVFGVRFDLPLWNRNRGNRRAARAAVRRADVELAQARREAEQQVRVAIRRYRSARDAFAAFDRDVARSLAENLKLARESLAAGKLGLVELNQVRRDLVDSRLARLDSLVEAIEARAALSKALGRPLEDLS